MNRMIKLLGISICLLFLTFIGLHILSFWFEINPGHIVGAFAVVFFILSIICGSWFDLWESESQRPSVYSKNFLWHLMGLILLAPGLFLFGIAGCEPLPFGEHNGIFVGLAILAAPLGLFCLSKAKSLK